MTPKSVRHIWKEKGNKFICQRCGKESFNMWNDLKEEICPRAERRHRTKDRRKPKKLILVLADRPD